MSGITVELSELDADLWETFRRGGAWVAHSEYMKLKADNDRLRELCKRALKNCYDAYEQVWGWDDDWVILCDEARKLGVEVDV